MLMIIGLVFVVFSISVLKNRKNLIENDLDLNDKLNQTQFSFSYKASKSNPYGLIVVAWGMLVLGILFLSIPLIRVLLK